MTTPALYPCAYIQLLNSSGSGSIVNAVVYNLSNGRYFISRGMNVGNSATVRGNDPGTLGAKDGDALLAGFEDTTSGDIYCVKGSAIEYSSGTTLHVQYNGAGSWKAWLDGGAWLDASAGDAIEGTANGQNSGSSGNREYPSLEHPKK